MNVLITGVGGPTPIGVAKSLRLANQFDNLRIIGVDSSRYAAGLYDKELFDNTYLIPHSDSDNYWPIIEKIVANESIDYAFIVPELEVLKWSQRQTESALPCKALLPHIDIAKIFYDKFETFKRLNNLNLVPRTIQINKAETLDREVISELEYPFWVRGGSGAGALGSLKVEKREDLQNWVKLNSHIHNFIASEYLPGRIYACKVLYYNGAAIRASCAERIDYLMAGSSPSGISGMCARGELINNDKLVNDSKNAIELIFDSCSLKPHGMFTVDFREDREGKAKITEINIRHVSFTHAFSLAGANLVSDSLSLLTGDRKFDNSFRIYNFDHPYTFIRGVDSVLRVFKTSDLKTLL